MKLQNDQTKTVTCKVRWCIFIKYKFLMCKFSMYNQRFGYYNTGFSPRNNIGNWDWFWSQTNSCFSNTYDHRRRLCAARLAGCCQVKIMYFGSGCEKMPEWHPLHTPPGPCRHRVNSFWVGPIHVIVAYTGLRTVWSHSRTWSLTFFQKMPDMLTQISKHWVWFVVCVWSFFLGYLILGM